MACVCVSVCGVWAWLCVSVGMFLTWSRVGAPGESWQLSPSLSVGTEKGPVPPRCPDCGTRPWARAEVRRRLQSQPPAPSGCESQLQNTRNKLSLLGGPLAGQGQRQRQVGAQQVEEAGQQGWGTWKQRLLRSCWGLA